jgi:hypothetical protein
MNPIHPKLLWAQLLHEHKIEELSEVTVTGWQYDCFRDFKEATEKYPEITHKFTGRPWNIYEFLQGSTPSAIVDFKEWGTIALSRTQSFVYHGGNELHHYALPVWINYVMSPELWGPQGKWIRFHQDLSKVLSDQQLLMPNSSLGRYILDSKAQRLESYGFLGSNIENLYHLVLPWSFSLSALKKLIVVIEQEF